jgi:1-carboxybiuret hydrolase subunit AtzG-like protein
MTSATPFDAAAYVDAAAAALGLPLAPAHRPGVIANMERIAGLALLVMELPLDEATEPAPVFEP